MTQLYRRGVYRFLLTRQWLILALLTLVLIPTMVELGFWQLHRHEHRVAQNALISHNLKAKPVPVATLTSRVTRSRAPTTGVR